MLHDFIKTHRTLLIDRCRVMVAGRSLDKLPHAELAHGIPIFVDQVVEMLAGKANSSLTERVSTVSQVQTHAALGATALLHGRDLFGQGFTLEQVIRDYGDVCQAVTGLAAETGMHITAEEFHTFNRCLDDAIAAAVTEYSQIRSHGPSGNGAEAGSHARAHVEHAEYALTLALANSEAALAAAKQDAHEARMRSLHDSLTGLPNRELFNDRLAQAISLAQRHDWTLAVMFLDLDQFKRINDAHGHTVGDAVLKTTAERLQRFVREEDSVCRTGGDEFLYLLMNPKSKANVEHIANSVLWGIAQPVAVGALEFVIRPSIGIALYPSDGASGDELIGHADIAMYRAKRHCRGFALFDERGAEPQIARA